MATCDLCDLPLPATEFTGEDGGAFCCEGCRQIAATVEDFETVTSEAGRKSFADIPADARQAYFRVEGMHCTTCEAYLAHIGRRAEGVYAIEANYGLESARVHYDPDRIERDDLAEALSGAGYAFKDRDEEPQDGDSQRRATVERLIVGGFFTMLIMPWYFFSLYPLYVGFESGLLDLGRTTTMGIYFPLIVIGVFTTIVLGYTGFPVLRGAWVSLRVRQPNMDLLVAIAALSAYCYSVLALSLGSTHLYFDVTVMVIMVVTLGRHYEGKLRTAARGRLTELTRARIEEATRLTEHGRERVHRSRIEPGDRLLVEPGEPTPFDGHVVRGRASVDESLLTGEGHPVARKPGDDVIGGSIVLDHPLVIEVGAEARSTIDRITRAMWEIQTETPGFQRFADALATIFVPIVLLLGVAVTTWNLYDGASTADAMLAGLTILLVSCPCAMGLATPLAVSAGLRDGLNRGVVVTNQAVFESAPEASSFVFDKTGTLTRSDIGVTEVIGHEETLGKAAAVERLATHPIADAILAGYRARRPDGIASDGGTRPDSQPLEGGSEPLDAVHGFSEHPARGVSGTVDGSEVVVGTPELVRETCGRVEAELERAVDRIQEKGGSAVVVGWDGSAKGVIGLAERPRSNWETVLDRFVDDEVTILTGDQSGATERFAAHDAVDQVFSGVPPEGKVAAVEALTARGGTVMVGDGTNDAPALAAASVGIAMGEGAFEATDAADVIIADADLETVETVLDLATGTKRRIRENIAWALLYNAIALPLAIVGLINPFFAALAMALSSVIVVTNSRRRVLP